MTKFVLHYLKNGGEVVGHPATYVDACDMAERYGKNGDYFFHPEGSNHGYYIRVIYGKAKGQLC